MLHQRLLPFALALLLVSPAASFAASATQDAYDDETNVVQDDTDKGSEDTSTPSDTTAKATPAPAPTTSTLPFTGLEAGLIAAAGLGLAGTGVALRRAAREQ
jgi:hypothetical protein